MNFNNLNFKEYYLFYLGWLLSNNKITKGAYELMRISDFNFNEYKDRFLKEDSFRKKQINLNKMILRDIKIDEISIGKK